MALERKKPMARDTPGARKFANQRSTLKRSAANRARTVVDRKPRPTPPDPITPAVRAAVAQRSGGRCEARAVRGCTGYGVHKHHRKLRRHGDHTIQNILDVCSICHDAIHGPLAASGVAYERRLLLHAWDDPADMPVIGGLPTS